MHFIYVCTYHTLTHTLCLSLSLSLSLSLTHTHIYIYIVQLNGDSNSVDGRCTTRNVVYQACISPMKQQKDGERVYMGISTGNWKQRWYSHRHSFSNPKLRYQTALSKYFWGLKDQGLSPQIKWKIIRHSSAANNFNGRCNLCLDEKISIINFKNRKLLLNERNELVFKCRHRGKFKLS